MSTTDSQLEVNEDDEFPFTTLIPIGIIISIGILIAIVGNLFTILAFFKDKRLKTVYNTYIVNLALTDLLIGLVSMSFYSVYILKSYSWPFGYHFCKVFMVFDFTLCLETVLMMILLSWDRISLLTKGPMYMQKETLKMACFKISVSWIIAFLLYGPAIIGWDIWTGVNVVDPGDCDVQFAFHFVFTMVTSVIEFAVPFICLCVLNLYIYYQIRKRTRVHHSTRAQSPLRSPTVIAPETSAFTIQPSGTKGTVSSVYSNFNSGKIGVDIKRDSFQKHNVLPFATKANTVRRDTKAAKCLVLLVAVFLITWAPYTITTIIISVCDECVSEYLYDVLTYLLWMKAALNPFLYAYNSKMFKENFKAFLCCSKRRSLNNGENATLNENINQSHA